MLRRLLFSFSPLLALAVVPQCIGGARSEAAPSPSAAQPSGPSIADLKVFLARFAPGAAHEAVPHGVPSNYDWARASTPATLLPPNGETVANWWGQIYVDESGYIASNVRVAVQGVSFLALSQNSDSWVEVQRTDAIGGGAWKEDFHETCDLSSYDQRHESTGASSWTTVPGCNAHYWPASGQSPLGPTPLRAVMVVGFTRLILADPNGSDERDRSTYLNGLGADWRVPGGGCPSVAGSSVPVCNPIAGGKFIRVGSAWRTMVMQSLRADELDSAPLPPLSYFRQPDGLYFQ
jgi:hypothetical protein